MRRDSHRMTDEAVPDRPAAIAGSSNHMANPAPTADSPPFSPEQLIWIDHMITNGQSLPQAATPQGQSHDSASAQVPPFDPLRTPAFSSGKLATL